MDTPRTLTGVFVGALLAAPLAGVFYLAGKLVGLPFVPFDLFDWTARLLPGFLVTFGIDTMVSVLMLLGLDVADFSKTAEQLLALFGFLLLGSVVGGLYFAAARRLTWQDSRTAALVLAGLAGVFSLVVSFRVNQTATAGPLLSTFWVLGAFLSWGTILSRVYERLRALGPPVRAAAGPSPPEAEGPPPEAMRPAAEVRRPPREVRRLSRRRFLVRLSGGAALVTVVGTGLGRAISTSDEPAGRAPAQPPPLPFPNADDPLLPAPGTRAEYTPVEEHYRIDINLRPPRIAVEEWQLSLGGLVDRPGDLNLADLRAYPALHQWVTLSCISNRVGGPLIGTTLWTGVSLGRLLADRGVRPEATHVRLTSEDGFHEVIDLQLIREDERIMLTYAWNGSPLTREHGFPLRVYIPDRYGMKQPKWITGLEVVGEFQAGYWVRRGWDREAHMRATSVIDTVAVDAVFEEAGRRLVPVGGIAHAGARGISAVEVRVDEGPWEPARLRRPLSSTTWVIWRFDWPFSEGQHTLRVRCREGDGTPQIEGESMPHPSGATGIHSREAEV